jgi:CHAT domain-containing protein
VREAIEGLKDTPAALIGPALADFYSSGYDRICVWPHSIHHYSPIQAMETKPGRVLADDWLVTVMPTVECLLAAAQRCRGPHSEDRITLLVAASPNGGRSAGYPDVQVLADQAEQLVSQWPEALMVQPGRVTAAELARLMPISRYIHLAAHGEADPYAPLRQCLYLDGEGPGSRLTAADILALDLRAVEVVTLAACESALGRFDEADTQSGLTAALLAAGATAVVACLWPVRPEPAVLFFDQFYERLRQDGTDLRAAFGAAQAATRARFPAYRDWAVFTYIGGW